MPEAASTERLTYNNPHDFTTGSPTPTAFMDLSEHNLRSRLRAHQPREANKAADTPHAAVAAVLRYQTGLEEPDVLLIRRTSKPSDPWSGHMAFPGGRQEPHDRDLVHTAKRETVEEVGVDLERDGELIGRLDDVQAISKARPMDLIIVPHVFLVHRPVELVCEKQEVAEALWTPLGPMVRGEIDTTRPYERDGRSLELPGYRVGPHVVWGLTYRMLQLLFEAVIRDH